MIKKIRLRIFLSIGASLVCHYFFDSLFFKTVCRLIEWQFFPISFLYVRFFIVFFAHVREKMKKKETKVRRLLLCGLISIIDWNTQKVFLFFRLQSKYVATSRSVHALLLFLFLSLSFPRTDSTKQCWRSTKEISRRGKKKEIYQ